jgi:hypothetical protein
MKAIEFKEQTIVIAKDQPEYTPLPSFVFANDPTGRTVFCWQLSLMERLKLLFTGKLWHQVMTFNHPLQPQMLTLSKPFTPQQVLEAHAAKAQAETRREFEKAMIEKYGKKIAKKKLEMDRMGYHANDRRRSIVFETEDFARAKELGILFAMGFRIVDPEYKTAV